jgi:AraC-like DNA-binding protein
MPKNSLITHYALNLKSSNFNLMKIEDLLKQDNEENIINNHKVDFYVLLFITENIGRHSLDFKDYYYSKGTVLSIRKDQIHKFYPNKAVKGFLLFFREEFLNSYLNEIEVAKTIQMFNEMLISPKTQLNDTTFSNVLALVSHIQNELLKISDTYSKKIIRSLLHILITLLHRYKAQGYDKLQLSAYLREFMRFQHLIEQDYFKTKKVLDYASKLGFSTKKLNAIVKFIANKPAKSFIDETVIVKIKRLLLHSNFSVKEIAFKVGFKDPANLHKYFKKNTNTTPDAFRKKYNV